MNTSRSLIWSIATVLVAMLLSYAVARRTLSNSETSGNPSTDRFHDLLHTNLRISAEQEELLRPLEQRFESDLKEQRDQIAEAGRELASAIREHEPDSEEVAEARQQLLDAQGQLQRLTLDHFFAMKNHLSPEQGEQLLRWTHDSIVHGYPQ